MAGEKDLPKSDIRNKTSWAEANDARGQTEVHDPNKGPKRKRK